MTRVVLITGCSSGFGLELAAAFAERGDQVVATVRDLGRASALRSRLGQTASIRQLDVTQPASIDRAVADTLAEQGQIDVLVNNAGVAAVGALEVLPEDTLREAFDVNVFGALAVTRAVLPHMRQRRSGRIVFLNAIGGLLNTPYLGAYCASKHALDGLAATLDIELRPFGVRASSVLPSAYHTQIAGNMRASFGEGSAYEAATRAYHAA